MSKNLLVISSREEDREFGEQVAHQAGLSFRSTASVDEGVQIIDSDSPDMVFVDGCTERNFIDFESKAGDALGLFSDKLNPNKIYFIYDGKFNSASYMIKSPMFGNAFDRSYGEMSYTSKFFGKIIRSQAASSVFGLQTMMGEDAKIQSIKFRRTGQKQEAVDAVRSLAVQLKFQNRAASTIANAVDETIMNAMFDAPIDNIGKRIYSNTSRTADMPLTEDKGILLQVGYDGVYFGVSVQDQYGSLDKSSLFEHMSKSYANEDYKIKFSTASAGLGLATLFAGGGSIHFACESGSRTEVTLFYRRTESYRDFKNQFQFLGTQFFI